MPLELRQRRQAGYGKPQGYGEQKQGYGEARSTYAEVQLPKSYSLPNTYEKPNAATPTCCKFLMLGLLKLDLFFSLQY